MKETPMSKTPADQIRSRLFNALYSRRGFLGTSAITAATLSLANNARAQERPSVIEG
jgi:hypothetical protein